MFNIYNCLFTEGPFQFNVGHFLSLQLCDRYCMQTLLNPDSKNEISENNLA